MGGTSVMDLIIQYSPREEATRSVRHAVVTAFAAYISAKPDVGILLLSIDDEER